MKRLFPTGLSPRARTALRRGVTLIELFFALAILSFVAAMIAQLLIVTGREQRAGYVEQQVFNYADRLQDRITMWLQDAATGEVMMTDPNGAWFETVVFRREFTAPLQRIHYDPGTFQLEYDPDLSIAGNEEIIGPPQVVDNPNWQIQLQNVLFFNATPTLPPDDSVNTVVLVQFQVTDNGWGREIWWSGQDSQGRQAKQGVPFTTQRSFAVGTRRD